MGYSVWDVQGVGYLREEEVIALQEVTRLLQPGAVVINIGAGAGTSGLLFAEILGESGFIYTIDPQEEDSPFGCLYAERAVFEKAGLSALMNKHWFQINGKSQVVGVEWEGPQVDLLFIDGDHTYDGCYKDIVNWYNHVKVGGFIAVHDYGKDDPGYEYATEAHLRRVFVDKVDKAVNELLVPNIPIHSRAGALVVFAKNFRGRNSVIAGRNVDAIMPVARKDFCKLFASAQLLIKNVGVDTLYIVSPEPVDKSIVEELSVNDNIVYLEDRHVLPFDASVFTHRSSWVYQQFIKLLQDVTESDWYISVDADLFVLKPLPFFGGGKPSLFFARDYKKIVPAYGRFTSGLLGIEWNEFSLMNDIALYNKGIVRDMVRHVGGYEEFVNRSIEICGKRCFPAEAQLYYAWVVSRQINQYAVLHITNGWRGMYGSYRFSRNDIEKTIALGVASGADTFSIHTWGDWEPDPGVVYTV